jgi:hypothetical protein
MKKLMIYLICSLMGLTISCYAGSVPQLINYQGTLKTSDNTLPFTGTKNFEFNIYDAAINGNKIWGPQIFNNVPVIQGIYNVILGSTDSTGRSIADAFGDQQRFLGITMDDGNELEPRQQVLSSPFSFHAAVSDYADKAGHAVTSDNANVANKSDYADKAGHAVTSDNANIANKSDYAGQSGHAITADNANIANKSNYADQSGHAAEADKAGHAVTADKAYQADIANISKELNPGNITIQGNLNVTGTISGKHIQYADCYEHNWKPYTQGWSQCNDGFFLVGFSYGFDIYGAMGAWKGRCCQVK